MTYQLTDFGKTRIGLPGVPWRDLTDAEYREARELHPGMEDQGYFVHVSAAELKEEHAAGEAATESNDQEPATRGRRSGASAEKES